ncbi:MAG: cysteine dioxygenase [Trebonia sp.]|uniref:cysteine dioxygenase n=1 Tax=Trebonia sp. TaxID=2767075 RepID=UPI003BAE928A
MNADLSVAPEIAQLAAPFVLPPQSRESAAPHTVGRKAGQLSELAAAPQRWWDLVRFDPDAPLRVPVPGTAGAWLLVLPPGAVTDCDCGYATLLAGEVAEAGRPLRAGRVRVHGSGSGRHRMLGAGHGYSVSLHYAARPAGVTPGE